MESQVFHRVFSDFKKIWGFSIPDNKDPTIALDQMEALYDRLTTNKVVVPEHLRALILMSKLPLSMESSILLATANKEISQLNVADLRNAVMLHWDQKSNKKQGSSSGDAQKLSAIKHKKGKQSFSQQQQSSAPSGGSDGAAEKKKSRRSKRGWQAGKGAPKSCAPSLIRYGC